MMRTVAVEVRPEWIRSVEPAARFKSYPEQNRFIETVDPRNSPIQKIA
jgi:hypothetical protein